MMAIASNTWRRGAPQAVGVAAWGVVSAFGLGLERLWQGLLCGQTRFAVTTTLGRGPAVRVAAVPEEVLSSATSELVLAGDEPDRTHALLHLAAKDLMVSPLLETVDRADLGVCLGTTQGAIWRWERWQDQRLATPRRLPSRAPSPACGGIARYCADLFRAGGPISSPSMACASGTAAIGIGASWIRSGRCKAVIAGGVDALSYFVHRGFMGLKALDKDLPRPFDRARGGLGLGESAALLLLVRATDPAVAVAGFGLSGDANHLTGPDRTGAGAARAIESCLADARLEPGQVDFISAHGTATPYNDLMESKAYRLAFGSRAEQIPVHSIKGALGHSLAAAGALEAIVCCRVIESGTIPPTANLDQIDPEISLDVVHGAVRKGQYRNVVSVSCGFGGINAALAFAGPNSN
jgi:3-oxoacyl-(acyl-carrier-protein) synthase